MSLVLLPPCPEEQPESDSEDEGYDGWQEALDMEEKARYEDWLSLHEVIDTPTASAAHGEDEVIPPVVAHTDHPPLVRGE